MSQSEVVEVNQHGELPKDVHPADWVYVRVAIFLAIATGIEVGLYYVKSLDHVYLVVALLTLAIIKFATVALYFMHLKYDNPILKRLFTMGLLLASVVYVAVLFIFGVLKA